jgi:hypothetical protein
MGPSIMGSEDKVEQSLGRPAVAGGRSKRTCELTSSIGFTPLFDVPIKIENRDEPLGTHVFTLLEMQNGSGPNSDHHRRGD